MGYSEMIQQAQREMAPWLFDGQTGDQPPGYSGPHTTSGLDETSKAAQERFIADYEQRLANVKADLGAKYEFAEGQLIGGIRSGLGARGIGRKSGVGAAAEAQGLAPFKAARAGEEFGLETSRIGTLGGQLGSAIGLGRETQQYLPLPGAQGGGGGSTFIEYEPSRFDDPYSPGTNRAYERNRGR